MADDHHMNTGFDDDDHDSGIEDTSTLNSMSIRSSIADYQFENGRRYHAYRAGQYPLPNDEEEQSRMDILHHIWLRMIGGELLVSKPPKLRRVLDVGTGTGAWAIDLADEQPDVDVIGTDLSPIQPGWVPPNCNFYVDDAEADWNYEPFTLIHGRSLGGSISDWPRYYQQCYDSLESGGYLEMQEHAAWINAVNDLPSFTADWNVTLNAAAASFGRMLNVAEKHVNWMREAGFVDVSDTVHQIPIGTWQKGMEDVGRLHLVNMLMAVETYTLALYTKVLGKSVEETKIVMEGVKSEFRQRRNKLYVNYHFITARKPYT